MKHVKIQIGNLVTWERIDDNEPVYIPIEGKKDLDDELKPIVNKIIDYTINDEKQKFISMPTIIGEIELPELANARNDFDRKKIIKSSTTRLRKAFLRFLKENEEWKSVFISKQYNGGGYRLKNYKVLNNSEISKSSIVTPQETNIIYEKSVANREVTLGVENDPYDDSLFIDEYPPAGTKCFVGEEFKKTWTIKNAGSVIWHNRSMRCDILPSQITVTPSIVKMPDVKPGEEFTLEVKYKANDVGVFCSTWRVYDEKGNKAFPHKTGVGVTLIVEKDLDKLTEWNQISRTNNFEYSDDGFDILDENIANFAELINCCSDPTIKNAISCSFCNSNSFELNYQFGLRTAEAWPEFISAVIRFSDVVNMYELYLSNRKLKLHFEIVNFTESIKKIQIEFQTYNNQIISRPFVVEINSRSMVVDIPLSYFSKDAFNLRLFRNLCFVIKDEHFLEPKGTVMINRIGFI